MFTAEKPSGTKSEIHEELLRQARGLLEGERDPIANAANISALIWDGLPDLNWAGFYFTKGGELVLGPFQGKPACVRIAVGKGVCGTAVQRRPPAVVPNVHEFPGHIACDSASNSEVVVPLMRKGKAVGVLDLDSPLLNRFDASDAAFCEAMAKLWVEASDRMEGYDA
jgi:L-methionine (R)-S-oxide reductase